MTLEFFQRMTYAFFPSSSLLVTYIILILFIATGCSSNPEPQNSAIPFVSVNKRIDLDTISGELLLLPNGYLYATGGYAGLVIYHSSNRQFFAYDRACSYDYKEKGAVIDYLPSDFKFVCQLCRTEYNTNGQVVRSPGSLPLHTYQTFYDTSNKMLTIAN